MCVSSQRDHARESVVPSLSVVVVVVVVNVTTRLREREDVCVITHYFTFQKKVQKVKSPPRVNETTNNNNKKQQQQQQQQQHVQKKTKEEEEGGLCKNTLAFRQF